MTKSRKVAGVWLLCWRRRCSKGSSMKTFITFFLLVLLTLPTPAAAQTRDSWRSVRTNNLFVIGNAEPEKLRQVAVWLEFFHGAFGRIVSRNVIDSSVP